VPGELEDSFVDRERELVGVLEGGKLSVVSHDGRISVGAALLQGPALVPVIEPPSRRAI